MHWLDYQQEPGLTRSEKRFATLTYFAAKVSQKQNDTEAFHYCLYSLKQA